MSTQNPALNAAYDAAHEYAEANNLDVRCPIEPIIDVAITAYLTKRHQDGEQGDGWLPIETAPKDCSPVIVSIAGSEYHATAACFSASLNRWILPTTKRTLLAEPTHWQPLPLPPEEVGE